MNSSKRTNKINNITFKKCPLLIQIANELSYENSQFREILSQIINTVNSIQEPDNLDGDSIEYIIKWSNTLEAALSDIETISKFYARPNTGATNYKVTA